MKDVIGKRIRKIRESKDYSQENVAGELNMTTSAYSKIERGITDASASKLIRIAEILEVEVTDFFMDFANPGRKSGEETPSYGFATKGDIEEVVKMIRELARKLSQLEEIIAFRKRNTPPKKSTKK